MKHQLRIEYNPRTGINDYRLEIELTDGSMLQLTKWKPGKSTIESTRLLAETTFKMSADQYTLIHN